MNVVTLYIELPFLMGIIASIVHVYMGPDHLAAVTPLVFDVQKKHWKIGFLWGIGHVIGMLLIGVLLYFFKEFIPVETISIYSEKFVGFILIGLGIWSFYRIKNKKSNHKHPHTHLQNQRDSLVHIHKHKHVSIGHDHVHKKTEKQNIYMAVFVGVIHGFAGVAHFVLLLPVLGFNTKQESLFYIFGFGFGIVLAMLLYTLLLGRLQKNKPDKFIFYNLQFWSGVLAIIVGIYWILMT